METVYEPRQGAAKVRRTSPKNPMEVLVNLIEADPTADAKRLFNEWFPIIQEDEELLVAALQHTFTNLFNAIKHPRRQTRPSSPTMRAQRAQQVARAAKVVVEIMLLNLTLPSGKLLRDAAFKELTKTRGFFGEVAKRGKPDEIVGRILSENDLREIWVQTAGK